MEPYVLYENRDFIVFYKPPYYIMNTSHIYRKMDKKTLKKQWNSDRKPFLVYVRNYLINNYNIDPGNPSYNVCQRLDIETSGAVLTSTGDDTKWKMCRDIISNKKNTVKVYVCLVNGILKNKKGFIYKNIKCKKRPTYCTTSNYNAYNKHTMPSASYYEVLAEYSYKNYYYSLILIRIFTGRTHQIRVHMKSLGHTIVSDDRYTNNNNEDNRELINRMFLHNVYLKFNFNNKDYTINVPLPEDITDCLNKLTLTKRYNFNFKRFIDESIQ